jgi:hypothetical protein
MWRRDTETGQAYALQLTAAGAKAIGLNQAAKPENAHSEKDVRRKWNWPARTATRAAIAARFLRPALGAVLGLNSN